MLAVKLAAIATGLIALVGAAMYYQNGFIATCASLAGLIVLHELRQCGKPSNGSAITGSPKGESD